MRWYVFWPLLVVPTTVAYVLVDGYHGVDSLSYFTGVLITAWVSAVIDLRKKLEGPDA